MDLYKGLCSRQVAFSKFQDVLFCSQNPGTELEESYLKFVKINLERFRAHLNDEKMKKQLIKVKFA